MRDRDQIRADIEQLRRSHSQKFGATYDDGQLEALLHTMAREKLQTSMRSSLFNYDATDLVKAIEVLGELKSQKKGKK